MQHAYTSKLAKYCSCGIMITIQLDLIVIYNSLYHFVKVYDHLFISKNAIQKSHMTINNNTNNNRNISFLYYYDVMHQFMNYDTELHQCLYELFQNLLAQY